MIRYLLPLLSLFVPFIAYSSEMPGYFSGLARVEIQHTQSYPAVFNYNTTSTVIVNELNPQLSGEYGYPVIDVAEITVSVGQQETYRITFDERLGVDPGFTFYRLEGTERKPAGRINGVNLYWPRGRQFYTSDSINAMYEQKRKYVLLDGQIKEVQQPFMYVGLEGELQENIILYTSKELREEVGHLPAGANVTVLLEDNDFYLLKTSFGLVGWIKIEQSPEDTVVKGLHSRGR